MNSEYAFLIRQLTQMVLLTHAMSCFAQGFFALFWISMFLLVVQNYVTSYEKQGYPIELAFAAMFSQDAITLALSDGVLVLSTGFSVLFATTLKKNIINYYFTGVIIQLTFQTLVLSIAILWTFNRHVVFYLFTLVAELSILLSLMD